MAKSPEFKVFTAAGEYVASCHYAEDAACLIALRGGGTIRRGHSKRDIVWTEGAEDQPASESYDHVAEVIAQRKTRRNPDYVASLPSGGAR